MQLVLRNSQAKIRTTFVGLDGEATDPTNPKVTVTRDSTGDVVAEDQAATLESGEGTGVVSYTLDPIDTVDLLHVTWSSANASAPASQVAVVGGHICTLEQIDAPGLTVPQLRLLREAAERRLEDACGVAFRPSYHREQIPCDGTDELLLGKPRAISILRATLDGRDVTGGVATGIGSIVGGMLFPRGSVLDVAYSHGWVVAPEPVTQAAIKLAEHIASGVDDRVSRFREDDQEIFFAVPGAEGFTGIPDIDRVIRDYGYSSVG